MLRARLKTTRKARPIRWTDEEWRRIQSLSAAAGITASDYVRGAALANRIPERTNERALRALFDLAQLVKNRIPDASLHQEIERLVGSAV